MGAAERDVGGNTVNAFERHGIRHLSASSINLYRAEPALWVARYLYGIKDDAGPKAWRGTAVEAAVDLTLYKNCSYDEAVDVALQSFEMSAQGDLDEKVDKERQALPSFVRQAVKLLDSLGEPIARQFRVEQWLDGIDVPIIGYVDYLWADTLLELKTTWAMPSAPREDHAAQVVSYADATDRTAGIAYVTPRKGVIFPSLMLDATAARRAMLLGARAIRGMLSRIDSKEHAASMFSPNLSSFYWTEATKEAAAQIWKVSDGSYLPQQP